ncbi:hypothetical protein DERP_004146 [Dermatophagoides pteronyssinus]|uniref:Uncharacterized protein n=1 Tax=Dermatophagoides pteronyssinus TaxID=6956 RepID=A0ABQ8J8B6_DERPT|nr:hypothetical protein DERP_004146 [Dermatophagoides pteronyssinus]
MLTNSAITILVIINTEEHELNVFILTIIIAIEIDPTSSRLPLVRLVQTDEASLPFNRTLPAIL